MTIAFHASSQDACGVTGVPDPQYFQNLSPTSDQLTLKLYFNIIRDDNENFGYDQRRIPLIISEIENGFIGTDINFEFVCDVQVIDETDLVSAGTNLTSPTGGICAYDDQTSWVRHTDGIDIFINQNGSGNALGVSSSVPGKYAVIREDSGPANTIEGTTIVHELGHLFGLMHMHRGQNNIPYHYPNGFCGNYSGGLVNLNQCTDYECADAFSYVCGLGFVQDEEACAEHRSGPAAPIGEFPGNGKIAGDLIPDTPPSHSLAERSLTACAPDNSAIIVSEDFPSGVYTYEVKDISGSQFQPDISNYMSIIKDKTCRNHFTEDQIEVMKNHIRSHPLLSNFHSTKGQLACDCDYENIIYLRDDADWSQVVLDQDIDLTTLNNYEIVIEENLTIDIDYTFSSCIFTMGDDANIIVQAGKKLSIDGGIFSACETRWGEIYLEGSASLDFFDVDMSTGINAIRTENNFGNNNVSKSDIKVHSCTIDDFTESGISIHTNSTASLQSIDISNVADYGIDLVGNVDAEVLIGIDIDGSDRGIRVFNSPYWQQVNDCTFTNCHIGVRYNGASGSIHDSEFGKTTFGVTINNSAHSYIYRNDIGYYQNGVTVSNSFNTNINRNNIGLPQEFGNHGILLSNVNNSLIEGNPSIYAKRFGIRGDVLTNVDVIAWRDDNNTVLSSNNIYMSGNPNTNSGGILYTVANSCNITDNFIHASEISTGIEMNNSPDNTIRNNYVDISSTPTLFRAAAIRNMGSIDMTVLENETYSSNNADGILAQNSGDGHYECNFIHDSHNGLAIEHNSAGQYLRANRKISPQNFDFIARSRLGEQNHLGNKYYGGVARAFMSTDDVLASIFNVENITLHLPPDRIPAGNVWYKVVTGQDDDTCSGNIGPGGTGIFFSNPVKLCDYWDDIKPLKLSDPQLFLIKVSHIIRYFDAHPLMAIPDCIKLDPIFINLCGIHELMDIVDRIIKVGHIDPARSVITTNIGNMRQLQREYDDLTDPTSKANKLVEIKNLNNSSKPDFDQESIADHLEIQSIKSDLATVSCSQYMIQVMKDVWTIYLDELDANLLDTNPRLASNINTISNLCSDEYGDAVHLARSIALIQGSENYYDSNDGCRDNDYTVPRSKQTANTKLELTIAPNPTSGRMNIEFNKSVSGVIHIYKTNGTLIKSHTISNYDRQVMMIERSGVYIAKFIHDNGEIISKKIVVIN